MCPFQRPRANTCHSGLVSYDAEKSNARPEQAERYPSACYNEKLFAGRLDGRCPALDRGEESPGSKGRGGG